MSRGDDVRRGIAVPGVLLAVLLAASCAPRSEGPAPVVSGAASERAPLSIAVERGQTLSGIAQAYHVPMGVIAEANGLSAPFSIQAGRRLIIPGAGSAPAPTASTSVAALPPVQNSYPPAAVSSEPIGTPTAPQTRPVEHPLAGASESSTVAVVPPAAPAAPSVTGSAAETPGPSRGFAPTASTRPPEPSPPASPTQRSSVFVWPVRGHIVANFGSRSDGTHNDGINIAAPRGTAVLAVDAGVVAYSGNELRGYGNLILIKHLNGWISAYAHCDQILVRRGQKVARGEVIARVGSTGSVREPQLHFELRRGNHPVDPREFLAPLPTASTRDSRSG